MKIKAPIAAFLVLLLAAIGLTFIFPAVHEHNPRDLSYWSRAGANQDWSAKAAQADPQAQFFFGLGLIRTNLEISIDRVPGLSDIPVFGKRFFETISYRIDSGIRQEQLAEAYRWINLAAAQGFAPAKEAKKLFAGRIATPNQSGPTNGSLSIRSETNRTSSAAGSRH
jgi:TPR repeat protein